MFRFLDKMTQAKIKWLQDPNHSNVDNLHNVRCEAVDISGTKRRHI
jgi:hypothetical protein